MYDRRVVRGNTFAALVIPVSMQPEATQAKTAPGRQRPRLMEARKTVRQSQNLNFLNVGYSNK